MGRQLFIVIFIGLLATAAVAGELAGEVTGRVVDETGQALAGVKVVAIGYRGGDGRTDAQEVASTTTGADGVFRLPPAVHVVAAKEGKCVDWAFFAETGSGDLTLRLGPAATVEGEIVDGLGRPVVGASVGLLLQLNFPWQKGTIFAINAEPLTAKTDNLGRFRFVNVPEGATAGFETAVNVSPPSVRTVRPTV